MTRIGHTIVGDYAYYSDRQDTKPKRMYLSTCLFHQDT